MKQNNIWFSLVLALLLWAFIPQRMMAEEVHVSTYEEFKKYMSYYNMTIILDEDLVVDESVADGVSYFKIFNKVLTVCLNGHNITIKNAPANSTFFDVYNDNTLFTLENGKPVSGKQGEIITSNTLLDTKWGATCYLKNINIESAVSAIKVLSRGTLYVEGETNYIKSTSDSFSPIVSYHSTVNLFGECELVANANVACLEIGEDEDTPVNIKISQDLDTQNELGNVIDYDKSIWERSYVKIVKNASYGEVCKDGEHNLELQATSPTCTEKGHIPYYLCTKCKRAYKDDAAKEIYYRGEYEIAALGHDFGKDDKCQREGCDDIRQYTSLLEGVNDNLRFRMETSFSEGEEYKAFTLYKYVPSKSGEVTFTSEVTDADTYGVLFDVNKKVLVYDDDSGEDYNFSLSYTVEEGKEYFLGVSCYYKPVTGSIRVDFQEMVTLQEGVNDNLKFIRKTIPIEGEEYKAFTLYKYMPSKSGEVTFTSEVTDADTYGVLFDANKKVLVKDDNSGEGRNFSLLYNVEEGKEYFLGVSCYNESVTGSIRVTTTPIVATYSLTDADTYQSDQKLFVETLTYHRTVAEDEVGKWQPLFVPFQMAYDEWKDDFDVAAINNVHEYYVATGGVSKREMEIRRITHGKLYASFPYLIRAKSAGEKTLTVKNTPLVTATKHHSDNLSFGNFIDFEETLIKGCYFVWGAYEPMFPGAVNSFLSLHDGALVRVGSEETIVPQRWYLIPMLSESNEEAKSLDISNDESFAKIAIREMGSGGTTGIEDIKVISSELDEENSDAVPGIYDLNGIRQNTLKKGVNIIRQADGSVRKIVKK